MFTRLNPVPKPVCDTSFVVPIPLSVTRSVACLAAWIALDYRFYFVYTPDEVSTQKYLTPQFAEAVAVARYVKERTAPDDYIFTQAVFEGRRGDPARTVVTQSAPSAAGDGRTTEVSPRGDRKSTRLNSSHRT